MIVEPFAKDKLEDNLSPVGRVYYSFSTMLCTKCDLDRDSFIVKVENGKQQVIATVPPVGPK